MCCSQITHQEHEAVDEPIPPPDAFDGSRSLSLTFPPQGGVVHVPLAHSTNPQARSASEGVTTPSSSVIATPPHTLQCTFQFKEYGPQAFHRLREHAGISQVRTHMKHDGVFFLF
jgi:hypothetical protein